MNTFNTIQEIESYLNILLITLGEDEYRMFIENTPILRKYDTLMNDFKEQELTNEFLQQVLENVKNMMNNRVKNY